MGVRCLYSQSKTLTGPHKDVLQQQHAEHMIRIHMRLSNTLTHKSSILHAALFSILSMSVCRCTRHTARQSALLAAPSPHLETGPQVSLQVYGLKRKDLSLSLPDWLTEPVYLTGCSVQRSKSGVVESWSKKCTTPVLWLSLWAVLCGHCCWYNVLTAQTLPVKVL